MEQGEAVRREKQTLNDTLKEERKKNESVDIYEQMCIYVATDCKMFLGTILSIHRDQLPIATVPRLHLTLTSYNSFGKIFCHLSLTAVLVSNYMIINIVYYDVVMSTLDCARVACIYIYM